MLISVKLNLNEKDFDRAIEIPKGDSLDVKIRKIEDLVRAVKYSILRELKLDPFDK